MSLEHGSAGRARPQLTNLIGLVENLAEVSRPTRVRPPNELEESSAYNGRRAVTDVTE